MISLKREYNKTYPYMSQDVQQVDRMCFLLTGTVV